MLLTYSLCLPASAIYHTSWVSQRDPHNKVPFSYMTESEYTSWLQQVLPSAMKFNLINTHPSSEIWHTIKDSIFSAKATNTYQVSHSGYNSTVFVCLLNKGPHSIVQIDLCSSGCSWTHSSPPASFSRVLGFQACTTIPSLQSTITWERHRVLPLPKSCRLNSILNFTLELSVVFTFLGYGQFNNK